MVFDCVSRTHVGLRRDINEDSLVADSARGLWVVADGMGGHEAGEVASAMVVDALGDLEVADDENGLAQRISSVLARVNRELIDLARSRANAPHATIGTTVVGIAIMGDRFHCFWVGDSRAYLLRDGKLTRITHDHSVVQRLVDSGMLSAEEAETHENANLLTRAVGAAEDVEVDGVSGTVEAGDRFLLASDGLTRVVRDDELAAELLRSSPDKAADNLIETVLARGAPDNVSLIIVKVI